MVNHSTSGLLDISVCSTIEASIAAAKALLLADLIKVHVPGLLYHLNSIVLYSDLALLHFTSVVLCNCNLDVTMKKLDLQQRLRLDP